MLRLLSTIILLKLIYTERLIVSNEEDNKKLTKPIITHPPWDVFSTDGVLEFTCQASGNPKPLVSWYDTSTRKPITDHIPTSESPTGFHVNQHYGKLMISSPEKGKIYSFYCNASNSVGWTISHPPVHGGSAYLTKQFRQIPLDKTVHENDRVILECSSPIGIPEAKIFWLKNNEFLLAQQGAYMRTNYTHIDSVPTSIQISADGSLLIDPVSLNDAGSYICIATNVAGEQYSPTAILNVKPRTRFIETPADLRVKKGWDAKLRCRVEGNHIVKWKRGPGEGVIDPTRAELTESYLLLKNIQPSDAGTYICSAPGEIEADAVLTVDTPPSFSRTPEDLTVSAGEDALFQCIANGFPLPAIYWELPDKTPIFPGDLTPTASQNGRFSLRPDGSLEIKNVRLSDAGKYQCTAHSSIDTVHTSAILHVSSNSGLKGNRVFDHFPPGEISKQLQYNLYQIAPIIGLPPANQTRLVGELVTLDCELGTSREPSISLSNSEHFASSDFITTDWIVGWQRSTLIGGGTQEHLDSSGTIDEQRYNLLPGGSLQIIDVQQEDAGNYTCYAKAHLKSNANNPMVSLVLQSNWTSELRVVTHQSLINEIAERENPLSPPRNLRATNVTSSTVILVWDPSFPSLHSSDLERTLTFDSSKITYWVELYRPDKPTSGWMVVEKNWQVNTVQLGGLQPDTAYYFLIRPRWKNGRVGWASAPLGPVFTLKQETHVQSKSNLPPIETVQSVKNIEPNSIQLFPLSPKRIRVSWSVTELPNILSLITGYSINYREVPLMRCISSKFENLHPETADFLVRNADGPYCSLIHNLNLNTNNMQNILLRLEAMQRMKQESINQNPINSSSVSWFTADIKAQYSLETKFGEHSSPVTYQEAGLLRELDPFRCYEVKIKAYSTNSVFGHIEGRESISQTVLTYESFPNTPPQQIGALWISNMTIELSWNPPNVTSWNGLLSGYVIYVYDEKVGNHQNFNISYTEQKTLIKGLSGNAVYLIQIAAMTCKGIGVRSEPIRLNPEIRKKGLGVGWGYHPQTGQPLSLTAFEKETSDTDQIFLNRPWFIATIICSLLVWCVTVALITFCCKRQRNNFRKSPGTVLIANNSQCESINDSRNNNNNNMCILNGSYSMKDNKSTKRTQFSHTDQVQLESLIKTDNDNRFESNNLNSTYPIKHSTINSSHTYTINTSSKNEESYFMKDSCDTQFSHINHALVNVPISNNNNNNHTELKNNGLYVTTENLTNHSNIQSNSMQTSNLLFSGPNTIIHFSNICNNQHPSYIGYQNNLLSNTQIQTNSLINSSLTPLNRIGATGLPLIAPVAQIDNPKHNVENNLSLSSAIDSLESSVSVAPYATASIIQNITTDTIHTPNQYFIDCNPKECINNNTYFTNILPNDVNYESDNFLNSHLPNQQHLNNSLLLGSNDLMTRIYSIQHMKTLSGCMDENDLNRIHYHNHYQIQPQQSYSDFSNPNSDPKIKSSSFTTTTNSSLNQDDEKLQKLNNNNNNNNNLTTDSLSIESTNNLSTSNLSKNSHNSYLKKDDFNEIKLFVYENGCIPPPPKSPPPPAPKIIHNNNNNNNATNTTTNTTINNTIHNNNIKTNDRTSKYHQNFKESEFFENSSQIPSNHSDNSTNTTQSQNNFMTTIQSIDHNVYDLNFETDEDDLINEINYNNNNNSENNYSEQIDKLSHTKRKFRPNSACLIVDKSVINQTKSIINDHNLSNSSSFYLSTMNPDESTNPTYAQVY